ncbi:UNVERIFIED_CONTAM: hypothetical protein RF648_21320, partial [Kocuria sp. CPCC 205274]
EKASLKLLEPCNTVQELYDTVARCYMTEFGTAWEEVMLENARLLYIGQTPDNLFDWDWLDYTLSKEGIENGQEAECVPGNGQSTGQESSDDSGQSNPDCAG